LSKEVSLRPSFFLPCPNQPVFNELNSEKMKKLLFLSLVALLLIAIQGFSQVIPVGSGSYTKTFPGTDVLGRNTYPTGTPYLSGNAAGKPVPTSDWWSALIKNGQASNLFNYPFTMKTTNNGLIVT
jgi:hypothetical protein